MEAEDYFRCIQLHLSLLLTRRKTLGDRIGPVLERRTDAVIDGAPVGQEQQLPLFLFTLHDGMGRRIFP